MQEQKETVVAFDHARQFVLGRAVPRVPNDASHNCSGQNPCNHRGNPGDLVVDRSGVDIGPRHEKDELNLRVVLGRERRERLLQIGTWGRHDNRHHDGHGWRVPQRLRGGGLEGALHDGVRLVRTPAIHARTACNS